MTTADPRKKAQKKRILFLGEGVTLAHVVRPYVLAQCLDRELFDVHFCCAERYRPLIDETRCTYHKVHSTSPEEFLEILAKGAELFPEDTVRTRTEEDLGLLERLSPDAVVGDMRLSLGVSATVKRIPYVSLTNAYWSPFAERNRFPLPSFEPIRTLGLHRLKGGVGVRAAEGLFHMLLPLVMKRQARGLDQVRREYGLPPFENYLTGFTWGDITCFSDTPGIAPVEKLLPSHRYLGSVSWTPECGLPSWWSNLSDSKPIIYLSLGSSGPLEVLPTLFEALRSLDCQVVLATAGRIASDQIPSGFRHAEYLPGEALAQRADVVISNGGSPSTYQALAQGKPVLGIASNMDQLLCMTNVHRCGAGILCRADNSSAEDFKTALTALLRSTRHRDLAKEIAKELEEYRPEKIFPSILNEVTGAEPRGQVTNNRRAAHG
ncbi:MAG: glycosyl transferase family 1 [Bdellovibrionota bacterium]